MGSHYHTWLGRTAGVRKVLATLTLVLLCLPKAAMAHHMTGGEVPRTFFAGLLSGLAHPVIGPDHLAFILAVGIIAAAFGQGRIFPLVFLVASLVGLVIHLMGVTVPGGEIAVAVSVVGAGAFLAADKKVRPLLLGVGFALAGAFHGYAYGESVVGAEPAPLGAYLLGLVVIQYAVAMGAFTVVKRLDGRSLPWRNMAIRAAGVTVGVTGVVVLAFAI